MTEITPIWPPNAGAQPITAPPARLCTPVLLPQKTLPVPMRPPTSSPFDGAGGGSGGDLPWTPADNAGLVSGNSAAAAEGARISALQRILDEYCGYDTFEIVADAGNRDSSIRSLQFLRPALDDVVDPRANLVLVLIEPRLLAEDPAALCPNHNDQAHASRLKQESERFIRGGGGTPSWDLRPSLERFREDLSRTVCDFHGMTVGTSTPPKYYTASCVVANVFNKCLPHQDGRTLLALRAFLKAVKAQYPNFRGVILVGAFPEALIMRTTWAEGKALNEVLAFRSDIVLGDLDGAWESLYVPGTTQFDGVDVTVGNHDPNKSVVVSDYFHVDETTAIRRMPPLIRGAGAIPAAPQLPDAQGVSYADSHGVRWDKSAKKLVSPFPKADEPGHFQATNLLYTRRLEDNPDEPLYLEPRWEAVKNPDGTQATDPKTDDPKFNEISPRTPVYRHPRKHPAKGPTVPATYVSKTDLNGWPYYIVVTANRTGMDGGRMQLYDQRGQEIDELGVRPIRTAVAVPELLVSRINARHVAWSGRWTNRTSSATVYRWPAGGAQHKTPIPVTYYQDPYLERELLIDYFGRNHLHRRGLETSPRRCSGIAASNPDEPRFGFKDLRGAFPEFMRGSSDPVMRCFPSCSAKKETNKANGDLDAWLAWPALLRTMAVHGSRDKDGFHLLPRAGKNNVHVGGWTYWRDLWERRTLNHDSPLFGKTAQALGAGSFYWSMASAFLAPQNSERLPFSHRRYGYNQGAESVLFFGRGLCLFGSAHTGYGQPGLRFPVFPCGYKGKGEQYASSFETTLANRRVFGEVWRAAFESERKNPLDERSSIQGKTRRALNLRTCYRRVVIGDWSLRLNERS